MFQKCSSKYIISFLVVCLILLLYLQLHQLGNGVSGPSKVVWSPNPMKKEPVGQRDGMISDKDGKPNKKALLWNLMHAGPFKFLPDYKNPCWDNPNRWNDTTELPVHCLPYFYLIGAPKAGTTDLTRRLYQHPQISSKVMKDTQWLTKSYRHPSLKDVGDYQNVFLIKATEEVIKKHDSHGRHDIVFGDCSTDVLWNSRGLSRSPKPDVTTARVLYHLNPKVKIIVTLRDPVDRMYSDFLYFKQGGPKEFHRTVVRTGIRPLKKCFKTNSAWNCLYNTSIPNITYSRRVGIGLYSVHLREWFRVFPRDQIMVIKLEAFSNHTKKYMKKIFSFLDLAPVSNKKMQKISNPDKRTNSRTELHTKVGEMLPRTRRILQEFYRPFNNELVKLLGKSFDYNR